MGLCLRQCTNKLRRRQIVTDTTNQASVALNKIREDERPGKSCHTIVANTIMPMLPMAAPTASTPATFLPRIVPCNPARCFFSFCSFSSKVAVAGKIAGKARKSPPISGPYCSAITRARTQIIPPKKNRTANWYHFASRRAAKLTLMFNRIYLSSMNQSPREAANHSGIRVIVANKLDKLRFINSQLAQEA